MEGFNLKILSVHLQNFGSYKSLDFSYENNGLTLIQGPTGAGKSTLCDAIPWVLFGRTAKGGAVDEVRSWNTKDTTYGNVVIDNGDNSLWIARTRSPNDLYYVIDGLWEHPKRGKDLADTQKIINNLLGMDYELYLSGAYFHEFSQSAQFFTTTAKNRRAICEQLVDLSLPMEIMCNLKEKQKELSKEHNELFNKTNTYKTNLNLLKNMEVKEHHKEDEWYKQHHSRLGHTEKQYEAFEKNRKRVVSDRCSSCGTVLQKPKTIVDTSPNPHIGRLSELQNEKNPHLGTRKDFTKEIDNHVTQIAYGEIALQQINTEISDLEQLSDVIDTFRSELVRSTIIEIEENTNKMLSDFFDAEIRVSLEPSNADKLEVEIYKDGNVASFTQLSKGQRQLLKLTFGLSVMKAVGNHHGISFNQIFCDEVLDGVDENLQVNAYRLLQSLTTDYASIYCVSHSAAMKELFENKITVELVNGESQLCLN